MKLIENASKWHKLWSMRLLVLTTIYTAAAGAWAVLPPDWKPELGEVGKMVLAGIGVLLPVLTGVARLVDQTAKPDSSDEAGA